MVTSLTLYYTASVLVLLVVAAWFLYWGLERSVERENRDNLMHKVQVLTHLVSETPFDRAGIEQETHEEAEVSAESESPFLLRVVGPDATLIAETPDMAAVLPIGVFPEAAATQVRESRWRSPQGATFLLASSLVPAGPQPAGGWLVQAAFNISIGETLLADYRRDIAFVLVAGLLISAPLGIWIMRRGLQPIADITRATEGIGAQQLSQRINAGHWPKELVALARAFDGMLDRLQESFTRLQQFSADLAHEFRTPINNLMGEGQVALSRQRQPAEYERVLHSALEEHGRLARMIDSMLFLAQADQARSLLALTELQARDELQRVADFFQPLADEQGLTLNCAGAATLIADPLLLRRALSNLLSNAVKCTGSGGHVTLRAETSDREVTLSVTDSGVGIASEHLPRLGDRFYRVDPSRAGGTGAGLGLSIVRSIMVLHGGRLTIESTVGKGTSVSLVFDSKAQAGTA